MEDHVLNKQGTIQTVSHILWTVQFTRNVPEDDEQYLLRVTLQRNISKLYGQFCDIYKDQGRTGRMDNQVLKDSGKTQPMFQNIKV